MSPIALEFFGTPQIQRDGVPIHLPRRKATALLAYLAITEQPYNRDVLATLLWPEMSQRRARANLRQALFTLNKELGAGRLVYDASDISLAPQTDLDVDIVRFRNLLAAVAAHNAPIIERERLEAKLAAMKKLTAAQDNLIDFYESEDMLDVYSADAADQLGEDAEFCAAQRAICEARQTVKEIGYGSE